MKKKEFFSRTFIKRAVAPDTRLGRPTVSVVKTTVFLAIGRNPRFYRNEIRYETRHFTFHYGGVAENHVFVFGASHVILHDDCKINNFDLSACTAYTRRLANHSEKTQDTIENTYNFCLIQRVGINERLILKYILNGKNNKNVCVFLQLHYRNA